MSDAEIYLWPLFALFVIAAAGAAWQARNPGKEIAAREKILARDWRLARWRRMPLWPTYRVQQGDEARFTRSAARRAKLFAAAALLILLYLVLWG